MLIVTLSSSELSVSVLWAEYRAVLLMLPCPSHCFMCSCGECFTWHVHTRVLFGADVWVELRHAGPSARSHDQTRREGSVPHLRQTAVCGLHHGSHEGAQPITASLLPPLPPQWVWEHTPVQVQPHMPKHTAFRLLWFWCLGAFFVIYDLKCSC